MRKIKSFERPLGALLAMCVCGSPQASYAAAQERRGSAPELISLPVVAAAVSPNIGSRSLTVTLSDFKNPALLTPAAVTHLALREGVSIQQEQTMGAVVSAQYQISALAAALGDARLADSSASEAQRVFELLFEGRRREGNDVGPVVASDASVGLLRAIPEIIPIEMASVSQPRSSGLERQGQWKSLLSRVTDWIKRSLVQRRIQRIIAQRTGAEFGAQNLDLEESLLDFDALMGGCRASGYSADSLLDFYTRSLVVSEYLSFRRTLSHEQAAKLRQAILFLKGEAGGKAPRTLHILISAYRFLEVSDGVKEDLSFLLKEAMDISPAVAIETIGELIKAQPFDEPDWKVSENGGLTEAPNHAPNKLMAALKETGWVKKLMDIAIDPRQKKIQGKAAEVYELYRARLLALAPEAVGQAAPAENVPADIAEASGGRSRRASKTSVK